MKFSNVHAMDYGRFYILIALIMCSLTVTGCVPPKLASQSELELWAKAGETNTKPLELNKAIKAMIPTGPYTVVAGDKISISLEEVMEMVEGSDHAKSKKIERRIRRDGTISIPMIDEDIEVAGKTLLEIEELIEKAYWPEIVVKRPAIVVDIDEYATVAVSISGRGISEPGIYRLSSDSRSLSSLLMAAGGLNSNTGASMITATGNDGTVIAKIPVSIDFGMDEDVQFFGGERVFVEPGIPSSISLLGLINRPGRYPFNPKYPPTLIELITQAGGVREMQDPRYVSVYRMNSNNEMISARFRINNDDGIGYANLLHDDELGNDAFVALKANDIVVVEATARTRTREFLLKTVSLSVSGSASASTSLHKDLDDNIYGDNGDNDD